MDPLILFAFFLAALVNLRFFPALVPQIVSDQAIAGLQMVLVAALILIALASPIMTAVLLRVWQARIAPRGALWAVRAGGAAMLGFAALVAGTTV